MPQGKRTFIIGAGEAGEQLLRQLLHEPRRTLRVVGLVDDPRCSDALDLLEQKELPGGGWPAEKGTIAAEVSRDRLRPTRMTTRREGGRTAVSHFVVRRKLETRYGKFALLDVDIETGRTHQIRVHLSSVHHPVVGDTLYGAPRVLQEQATLRRGKRENLNKNEQLSLARNFLHAAMLEFVHPVTHQRLHFERVLPGELQNFLRKLELKDS